MEDTPVRGGYLDLGVNWAPAMGLTGHVELGARPLENLAVFAFGEWNSRAGPQAGVGLRLQI